MKRLAFVSAFAAAGAFLTSGCSVYMAANQPSAKNLTLLKPGTERAKVIAEFGAPVTSETKGGVRRDVIKFTQGYSTEAKAGRAVLHGAADVFTLGLWEVVGTPVEGHYNGDEISAEVVYDSSDRVAQVVPLSNPEQLQQGIAEASKPAPKRTETSSIQTLQ